MNSFFSTRWKQFQGWLKSLVSRGFPSSTKLIPNLQETSFKILCVDDDRSFCDFMQRLAYSRGVRLDTVSSIQEAKEKIENHPIYQAFIIDGHLPDGSGFELVAWIREKKDIAFPIGFISRIYQDATSFRILKETLKVNYVLEKPIRPAEVHQLLDQMCQLEPLKFQSEAFSNSIMMDLKASYQKTITDKIERLEKMILNVQNDPKIEHLQLLRAEVHKIAGSAGSYGYMVVSELCKNLEINLIKQIDLAKKEQLNLQWLSSLDDFFTQIKWHFQLKITDPETQELVHPEILTSVYVIDEDPHFIHQFIQSLQNLNFEILTENRPENAIQTLLTADFYPQILLIQSHFNFSSLTSIEILKAFYENNDELTSIIALIAQTLDQQIEAFQNGITYVAAKPFSVSFLISLLDQMPFRPLPLPYKVLILDDDPDICQYLLKILKYLGLNIKALQNFLDLKDNIESYQPDLILLDINLLDANGKRILHQLRKEWGYNKLLVGMLSLTQQDNYLLQQCYDANVNEILFKPLEKGVLQRKIAFLFKQTTEEMLSIQHDLKTGLVNIPTFKHYLHELCQFSQNLIPKYLVVFEVEELNSLDSEMKAEAFKLIGHTFRTLLKKFEIATQLQEDRFALIFQGYDPFFIQFFMRSFLLRIQSVLQSSILTGSFHIREILICLKKEMLIPDLLNKIDDLLLTTKQRTIHAISLETDPTLEISRNVFIFDKEGDSLPNLKNLFQTHHFQITTYSDLEDLPQTYLSLPLFILVGSLAETKGLYLLKTLTAANQIQIPILHLPYSLAEESLSSFFNQLSYFDSPFGLVILLTKVPISP